MTPPSPGRLAWPALLAVVVVAALAPVVVSDFFLNVILTKTLWLGEAGAGSRLKLVINTWLLALTEGLA